MALETQRRILHVITDLDVGGAEAMLVQVASAKDGWAAQTTVVSLLPGGVHAESLRDAGIDVVELDFGRVFGIAGGLFRLARLIAKFRPAVVQGWMYHGDLAALIGTLMSGRRRRLRLAWGIRCSDMELHRYGLRLRAVVKACAALSGSADIVIANSAAGLRAHRAIGYRPRREAVVPNGIDIERFKPDPGRRAGLRAQLGIAADATVVAHVARVDAMKDHATFLAAMSELPDLNALVIGAGTDRLPAAPQWRLLGRRMDVPELLNAADFIVSSSAFGEGFSNALAEGMACGLPAVATDVGDAAAIVGDTGLIVAPREPKALAAAIRRLAEEPPDARARRSAQARARIVAQFSLAQAVWRFAECYEALVPER